MRSIMRGLCFVLLAAACGDSEGLVLSTAPLTNVVTCEEDPTQPGCQEPPPSLAWLGGEPNLAYEAPGAPGSSATGIWLGSSVLPSTCFGNLASAPIVDSDSDFLADHCETELAKGFAPTMKFDPGDANCSGGEPLYGAKYFLNGRVRLAYLAAYYEDCGYADDLPGYPQGSTSHHGDSEFIMVEVEFDAAKQRWVMRHMFLSAHYLEDGPIAFVYPGDRSEWVKAQDAQWGFKQLGNPVVWVALWKHGSFKSKFSCDTAQDDCSSFPVVVRFPIVPGRNVGSRDVHACRESALRAPGSGRTECFYTEKPFRGWFHTTGGGSAGYYSRTLMSDKYEKWCPLSNTLNCSTSDWGPSLANPAYSIVLNGPGYVYQGPFTMTATRGGATPAGLWYEWQYIRCASPDHAACSANGWSTFATGVDRTSILDYISPTDQFVEYRIVARQTSASPVLYTTSTFRVWGAGEIEGCPPEDNFCVQLRVAPGSTAAPLPSRRKPPAARGVQ